MDKRILYLGTSLPYKPLPKGIITHLPLIETIAKPLPPSIKDDLPLFSHVIFTSRNAVRHFFSQVSHISAQKIAIGSSTAQELENHGIYPDLVAQEETQEGVIALLRQQALENAYILLPRSSLARRAIDAYLRLRGVRYQACTLYETKTVVPSSLPKLEEFDAVFFSSPSTVDAFLDVFKTLPPHLEIFCQGPVTHSYYAKEM